MLTQWPANTAHRIDTRALAKSAQRLKSDSHMIYHLLSEHMCFLQAKQPYNDACAMAKLQP